MGVIAKLPGFFISSLEYDGAGRKGDLLKGCGATGYFRADDSRHLYCPACARIAANKTAPMAIADLLVMIRPASSFLQ